MGGISAVIPAAGRGERLGLNDAKAFATLAGIPLLAWTLSALESCEAVNEVVVVARREDIERVWRLAVRYGFGRVSQVVEGGMDRQSSVLNGMAVTLPASEVILVHDAARPLTPLQVFLDCAAAAARHGSASAALPVVDTLRQGLIEETAKDAIDRSRLVRIQTPQAVRAGLIRESIEACRAVAPQCTDNSSMVELATGVTTQLVRGSELGLKITNPTDLVLAEALVNAGYGVRPVDHLIEPAPQQRPACETVRSGLGYDVHSFEAGRPMMLGGLLIPDSPGLAGHSDTDVLLHAVCDAILGAVGERDIGYHFPNTDASFAGASSSRLLERVVAITAEHGWQPHSVDVTVIAEAPRLTPHINSMCGRLAEMLGVDRSRTAVKATTNEKMGFIGRAEGIACFALATLRPIRG